MVDGNTISAYHRGIFHSLQEQDATAASITDNDLSVETSGDFAASSTNFGIELASILGSVDVTVSGNDSTGNVYGILLWKLTTTADVTIEGGALKDNQYGVLATSDDPQFGAGSASHAVLSGVQVVDASVAGIGVEELSGTAPFGVKVAGSSSVNGAP